MAATSDEQMENLLTLADQISEDFESGIKEIQTLKSNLNTEITNRQSLELKCSTLRRENERLKNLHFETLNNLTHQLQQRGNSQGLKDELQRLTRESIRKEEDRRVETESMRRDYEEKIRVLECRIEEILSEKRRDEATIYELHREVISVRNRLKEVEEKSRGEIEDLRDCVFVEQEEKKGLGKKIRDLEKELLVSKTKIGNQQSCGSSSEKQLDLMKQKMMKLRRDNEELKRQLMASKTEFK